MNNFKTGMAHWTQPARQFSWWFTWIKIVVGITIMSAGFVFFINPYRIVPGGVYGAGIVLHSLFPTIQVGTFGWFFDLCGAHHASDHEHPRPLGLPHCQGARCP